MLYYRNILVFCLVSALVFFLSFRRHWTVWARALEAKLQRAAWPAKRIQKLAEVGYHQMVLAVAGILVLLFFGDAALVRDFPHLYDVAWLHLRAPALTSLAFAFACHAAVLAELRR